MSTGASLQSPVGMFTLSSREFTLLAYLMRNAGQVLTRPQLAEGAWDAVTDVRSNMIDVYIAALRQKLAPGAIETVRGVGYRMLAEYRHASLRTRLAVLYAGLAVIVLAISLLTVYGVARRDALNRVDSSLRADANKLGSRTEAAEQPAAAGSNEQIVNARERVLGSGHLLAVFDNERVIASNAEARGPGRSGPAMGLFSGRERVATVTLPSGRVG